MRCLLMTGRFVLLALLLRSTLALAQGDPESRKIAEAKEHFFAGDRAYRLGDFDKSIEEFKKSYDLNPLPQVLYNLGQAYLKKSELRQARHFFEQFLSLEPNHPNAAVVKSKLADIEKRLQAEKSEVAPAKPSETAVAQVAPVAEVSQNGDPNARVRHAKIAAITLLTIGLGVSVAGAVLLGHASTLTPHPDSQLNIRDNLLEQQYSENVAGGTLLAAGGTALVGSIVSFALWKREKSRLDSRAVAVTRRPTLWGWN